MLMFSSYVKEENLDSNNIDIRTSLPVIITMSTIPARLQNSFKIIKHFLEHVRGIDMFILNIPYSYKRWPHLKVDVKHNITDPRFILNRCEDVGPMTKFLPSLNIIPNNQNNILIVCDDMCYKLDAFKDIAERVNIYRDRAFSFYVYDYKVGDGPNIRVPQGADLICTTTNNMRNFPNWFENFIQRNGIKNYKEDSGCFFVDDQVIGWYFSDMRIPMEQYERKHRNIYIKDCDISDTRQNLNNQKGDNERNKVMEKCYNQMKFNY